MVTARKLHDMEIAEQEVPPIARVDSWPRAVGFADADG
jgi:DNA recombination protein RmuC